MSEDLDTRAEIAKLAALLGVDPARLDGLHPAGSADLRELRERVTDALFDGDLDTLRRVAAGAKVVPAPIAATVAQRAFSPLLLARMSGLVDVDVAVGTAKRLPPEFLADVAVAMDPRRASDVIRSLPAAKVVAVARELTRRGEAVAMGRFVGHLTDETLRACLDAIDDAALLRCGFVLEEKDRLDAVIGLVPEDRLPGIIGAAPMHGLWVEALDLFDHVGRDRRAQLADIAAGLGEEERDGLVLTAARQGLWDELLPLAGAMSPASRARFASTPALADPDVVAAIVAVVVEDGLWDHLLPFAHDVPASVRAALVAAALEAAGDAAPDALRALAS